MSAPLDIESGDALTRAQLIDALQARDRGDARFTLIDIREEYELIHGFIAGAIHRPLSTFDADLLAGDVIVYCQAGVRSGHLVRELKAQGFIGVTHYAGGYLDWVGGTGSGT